MRALASGDRARRLSAVVSLAVVLTVDVVLTARPWPLCIVGLLDETAHLLTAWLFLAALLPERHRDLLPWALLGAVVIDLDHLPLYAWDVGAATDTGRPVTHSLSTVVLLLVLSAGRRLRTPLRGLALGVLLHLTRDLFTGPGVPLLWPASGASLLAPHPVYVVLLCAVTAAAVLRPGRPRAVTTAP